MTRKTLDHGTKTPPWPVRCLEWFSGLGRHCLDQVPRNVAGDASGGTTRMGGSNRQDVTERERSSTHNVRPGSVDACPLGSTTGPGGYSGGREKRLRVPGPALPFKALAGQRGERPAFSAATDGGRGPKGSIKLAQDHVRAWNVRGTVPLSPGRLLPVAESYSAQIFREHQSVGSLAGRNDQ